MQRKEKDIEERKKVYRNHLVKKFGITKKKLIDDIIESNPSLVNDKNSFIKLENLVRSYKKDTQGNSSKNGKSNPISSKKLESLQKKLKTFNYGKTKPSKKKLPVKKKEQPKQIDSMDEEEKDIDYDTLLDEEVPVKVANSEKEFRNNFSKNFGKIDIKTKKEVKTEIKLKKKEPQSKQGNGFMMEQQNKQKEKLFSKKRTDIVYKKEEQDSISKPKPKPVEIDLPDFSNQKPKNYMIKLDKYFKDMMSEIRKDNPVDSSDDEGERQLDMIEPEEEEEFYSFEEDEEEEIIEITKKAKKRSK